MATKKQPTVDYSNPPATLDKHPFFGLQLDDEQKAFRDAIWHPAYDIVFCNSKAGTGKTLISVATAVLMREYGLCDEVVYITAAGVFEWRQGLLPGDLMSKSDPYKQPLNQALLRLGYNPESAVKDSSNYINQKSGDAFITFTTNSFIRGINIGDNTRRVLCIVEESQNYTVSELQTVLSRIGEGSRCVVIGHDRQIDLKYKQDSGFVPFIEHFREKEWCKVCKLTKNYRGSVSAWADEI